MMPGLTLEDLDRALRQLKHSEPACYIVAPKVVWVPDEAMAKRVRKFWPEADVRVLDDEPES